MKMSRVIASWAGAAASFALGGAAAGQCLPTPSCSILHPNAGDRFGRSVSSFGFGLPFLIGAPEDQPPVGTGSSFIFSQACVPLPYLTGDPVGAPEAFGFSVAGTVTTNAASPKLAVVGAPTFAGTGAAYVRRESAGWAHVTLVQPAPQAANDGFGFAVAALPAAGAMPPRAFVGEPGSDLPAAGSGALHVFDATTGAFIATQLNPVPQVASQFGFSLASRSAANGCPDLLAVGAPAQDTTAGVDAGAVRIFDASTGAPVGDIVNQPGAGPSALLGFSVAFVGDLLAVGAPGAGGGVGAVYLFKLTGGCMPQLVPPVLVNPNGAAGDQFGAAISEGPCPDTVAVGAPATDVPLVDSGVVHIFRISTGLHLGTIPNPMPAVGDGFGTSVSSNGSVMAVGAPGRNAGAAFDAGAVYMIDLAADCNGNCVADDCDIASGFSLDIDCDGKPDECEIMCHADIAPACGDGQVNGADLGVVIGSWGPGSGPADINRDGIVNGADLGIIIGCWGPCTGSCP